MKKVFRLLSLFLVFLFCSCETKIIINVLEDDNVLLEFSSLPGEVFSNTIMSFASEEEQPSYINPEELKTALVESKLKNPEVFVNKNNYLLIKALLPKEKDDVLSKSNMLVKENGLYKIKINAENFKNFYYLASQQIQLYIDLLMSPVFTGEETSHQEYIDLLSSVYGQELCDELESSKITFIINQKNKKTIQKQYSLLEIINIKDDIIIE